ncbi:MAG TPA: AAA family ATPase [Actinomycetota bacterium]|nr:AAA family ATPase [Actinomycetota bacterium]
MDGVARIVLGIDSPQLAEEVVDFLDRGGRARVVASAVSAAALASAVREHDPNAVVGSTAMVRSAGGMNGTPFLALETTESLVALRGAVELGAKGFYLWPSERAALADAAAGSAPAKTGPPPRRASVVAVCGPRGGVGATFVATHLAAALARSGARTVLVDADHRFADLTVALGVPDDGEIRTVEDLEPVAGELEERHLDEVLWAHPAGFEVLLAPAAADADVVGAYRAAVPVAAGTRDAVVVHCGRAPVSDDVAGAVLPLAERIVLVLTQDVLSFRGARRALEGLNAAGLASRVAVVVNRAGRAEITPKDAERAFGQPPLAIVPVDRKVGHVQDRGLLLPGRRRSVRAIERLAGRLVAQRVAS